MNPEDIKSIRNTLNLTQEQAGSILGGGPRAFAKYESGKIIPSASLVALLKVLKHTPVALGALMNNGSGATIPMPMGPFEITASEIELLNSDQLISLMRRLIHAESAHFNLPNPIIHVPQNLNESDGGVDGSVRWSGPVTSTTHFPKQHTIFQFKAQSTPPAKVTKEIRDANGELKPLIDQTLRDGGAYVLVCSKGSAESGVANRQTKLIAAASEANALVTSQQLAYLDANQIAGWVNSYQPVALWLKEKIQPGLTIPFRSFDLWANQNTETQLIDDPRITDLRNWLENSNFGPRQVRRLGGSSGIGKTRALREAIVQAKCLDTRQVLYVENAEMEAQALRRSMQQLADLQSPAVIIADQCSEAITNDLETIAKQSKSRISLIVILNDRIQDQVPSAGSWLNLEDASSQVTFEVIKNAAPQLDDFIKRQIVGLSGSNLKLAITAAQELSNEGSFGALGLSRFYESMALGPRNLNQSNVESVLNLISVFGPLKIDSGYKELAAIGSALKIEIPSDVHVTLRFLESRGVLKSRSGAFLVTPPLLALHFAEKQWKGWSETQRESALTHSEIPSDLRVHAAAGLALLNDREIAREVVRPLFRWNGPFAAFDTSDANPTHAEILEPISTIEPGLTLLLLRRNFETVTDPDNSEDRLSKLAEYIPTLEKTARFKEHFEGSADCLLKLACCLSLARKAEEASSSFLNLFTVTLSSTAAGPVERFRFLDGILDQESPSPARLTLIAKALYKAADSWGNSRVVGLELVGARKPLEFWQPKSYTEAIDYMSGAMNRLVHLATRSDEIGDFSRNFAGSLLRGFIRLDRVDNVSSWIETVTKKIPVWSTAIESIGHALQYDLIGQPETHVEEIRRLLDQLRPQSFESQLELLVTKMPWDYPVDLNADFAEKEKLQLKAISKLVEVALQVPLELEALLPKLSTGEQRQGFLFGKLIGQKCIDLNHWAHKIFEAYVNTSSDEKNPSLLGGFCAGIADRVPNALTSLKSQALLLDQQNGVYAYICLQTEITLSDINAVLNAIDAGTMNAKSLEYWSRGGVLARRKPQEVDQLLMKLILGDQDTQEIGIVLTGMYVHRDTGRLAELPMAIDAIVQSIAKFSRRFKNPMADHHLAIIFSWILNNGNSYAPAKALALSTASLLTRRTPSSIPDCVEVAMPKVFSEYSDLIWPILGRAILIDDDTRYRLEVLLQKQPIDIENSTSLVLKPFISCVDSNLLFAWAEANGSKAATFLARVIPFLKRSEIDPNTFLISPLADQILSRFGTQRDVRNALSSNIQTFFWRGSVADFLAPTLQVLKDLTSSSYCLDVREWSKEEHVALLRLIDSFGNDFS
jgi:transcriptional regulator with XRE-family HTH domain